MGIWVSTTMRFTTDWLPVKCTVVSEPLRLQEKEVTTSLETAARPSVAATGAWPSAAATPARPSVAATPARPSVATTDEEKDSFDIQSWWRANRSNFPAFARICRAVLTHLANSYSPEAVVSILNDTFESDQESSYADYMELSLQLQFDNSLYRKIIHTNTTHIVHNWTEQAGETRLHPAGCNLLNHNKLPSCRTSSWMKMSSQKDSCSTASTEHPTYHPSCRPKNKDFREKIDRRRHRTHNLGIKIPFLPHLCLGGPLCVWAS